MRLWISFQSRLLVEESRYLPLACASQLLFPSLVFILLQQFLLIFAAHIVSFLPSQQFMAVFPAVSFWPQHAMSLASLPTQQAAFAASPAFPWQHTVEV